MESQNKDLRFVLKISHACRLSWSPVMTVSLIYCWNMRRSLKFI